MACVVKDGKYIILKNSKLATVAAASCSRSIKNKREKWGKTIGLDGIVIDEISFSSPLGLAKFATLSSVNGKIELKDANGKTLKEIMEKT